MALGGLALVSLLVVMGGHVLLRACGHPLVGAHEVAGLLGALAIACALADSQRQKMHVTVDLLSRRFPATIQSVLAGFNSLFFAVFYLALGVMVWRYGLRLRAEGELSETLKLPFHPVVFAVATGFVLLTLTLLLEVATLVVTLRSGTVVAVEAGGSAR